MSISSGQKITATDVNNHINNKSNPHAVTASQISGLATVATTGSYNDLSNKPNISSLIIGVQYFPPGKYTKTIPSSMNVECLYVDSRDITRVNPFLLYPGETKKYFSNASGGNLTFGTDKKTLTFTNNNSGSDYTTYGCTIFYLSGIPLQAT